MACALYRGEDDVASHGGKVAPSLLVFFLTVTFAFGMNKSLVMAVQLNRRAGGACLLFPGLFAGKVKPHGSALTRPDPRKC